MYSGLMLELPGGAPRAAYNRFIDSVRFYVLLYDLRDKALLGLGLTTPDPELAKASEAELFAKNR